MSPSKILFFLCISFIVGIFLESAFKIPQTLIWGILFFSVVIILVSFLANKNKFVIFGFCLLLVLFGVLRTQITQYNIENDRLSKLNGKHAVTFTGIVIDEPDVRDTSQKIKIKFGNSVVLATTKIYPEFKYLDKVQVTGKLEAPVVYDDFNYKDYLLKDGIYSIMGFPKIEIVGKYQANIFENFYAGILSVKSKLNQSIEKYFAPPQSLLLQGIILGNNKNMSQDLRDGLNATGLRFLTAISGVHVIILSEILLSLFLIFPLSRRQAFWLSIIFIWLYIVLTGNSASGLRAGIMGTILIMSQIFGRQNTSSRTIVLAGALMLFQNPLLLIYDAGFQLSFMASFGIIHFKPLVNAFIKSNIISVTLTAQLWTLPIMIFSFGSVSLVAPITNILIIPIFYYILMIGFCFSILAIFSNILGWIFAMPLWILVTYFLGVLNFFNKPWAQKNIGNISIFWIIFSYLIIFGVTYFLNKKYSQKII